MSKLRDRKESETSTQDIFVIVNRDNEFLKHIYEEDGVEFTKKIKYAEKFHIYPNGEVLIPKWYKTVNGKKIKNILDLAESVNCKVVKVKTETLTTTQYNFIDDV